MNKMRKVLRSQEGFTLIELMIVIVILGVLAAIIIPRMTNMTERARISAGESSLRSIYNGLEMYMTDNGAYPDADGTVITVDQIDDYIENFGGLDTFLGEWQADTAGYVVDNNAGTFSLDIIHGTDSTLKLQLTQTGEITPN